MKSEPTAHGFFCIASKKLNGIVRINKGVLEINDPLRSWIPYKHDYDNAVVDVLNDGIIENGFVFQGSSYKYLLPTVRLYLQGLCKEKGWVVE